LGCDEARGAQAVALTAVSGLREDL
jgi:hypothetical protein